MDTPPRRSRLHIVLALAVSGSSLAAMLFVGVGGLEAEAEAAPSGELALELHASAKPAEPRKAAKTSASDEPAPEPIAELPPEVAPVEAATPSEVEQVTVPDISGLRLWIARKRLSDVGLELAPREGKRLISPFDYPDYQVARGASFGQQVPVGSRVEVEVEYWAPRFAKGY